MTQIYIAPLTAYHSRYFFLTIYFLFPIFEIWIFEYCRENGVSNRRSIPFSLKTRRKTQKTRFFRSAAGNTDQLLCAPLFLFEPFHHPQPCRRSSSKPALFISLTHNSRLPLRPLCIARDTLINSRGSLETRRSDRGLLVDIPFFVISRRFRVPFIPLSQKLKRIAIHSLIRIL